MRILITGATGLIGSHLSKLCMDNGYSVNYLTTRKEKIKESSNFNGFYWDPSTNQIDLNAFKDVKAIIHLVGATVSKRWTTLYKNTVLESRTQTTKLLYDSLLKIEHQVAYVISASGISIYPNSETVLYTEEYSDSDSSFLGGVVKTWEAEVDKFQDLGIQVSKVRTGIVFASDEGAFPKLVQPIKFNLGAAFGNGKQWQSWIHIEDITGIYFHILKHELEGTYNAVAPNPIRNKKLMQLISKKLNKAFWLPNVPRFVLRLILGEMSVLITQGQLVSSQKIEELGFIFKYYNIESALDDLI